MNENLSKINLTPNVRTIGLAGGTGDGKTEITSIFASPKAKEIISKSVGDTNSTLQERIVVYTESLKDEMILAVKLKELIFERDDFNNLITNNISKIVREYGKSTDIDMEKMQQSFIKYLQEDIKTKVNSKAVLNFLSEEFIQGLICELANIFSWEDYFSQYSYQIYNKVKNNLSKLEVKDNSAKFSGAIKSEVEKTIDSMDKDRIWGLFNKINNNLKEVFFKYFCEDHKSLDGYYYYKIDLDKHEKSINVINAMFTSNDLRKGQRLSIEVLCKEIVIYAPMHDKIIELIKYDDKSKKVFIGRNGTVSIGVYDTKGLYHDNFTDEGNLEYLNKLLYNINYDALMLVAPLSSESNEAKLIELYSSVMKKYNKQVPIFILNNKVDVLIDTLYKELSSDDPLSISTSDEELSFDEIKVKVDIKVKSIREELQSFQHINRKGIEIISLPCYLKKDNRMSKQMLKEYNAINSIEAIIKEMSIYLEESSEKIKFALLDNDVSDIQIEVEEEELKNIIKRELLKKEVKLRVLQPAEININENIGKVPHGNAYNALSRRLSIGNGYSSNINENYFYNCHSFSINFPAMLRNFITKDLITELIDSTIIYKGGEFKEPEGKTKLKDVTLTYNYFNVQNFIVEMVYHKALIEAEKVGFSYEERFKMFMNNSKTYFSTNIIDIDSYIDSIAKSLTNAIKRAIGLHVIYV